MFLSNALRQAYARLGIVAFNNGGVFNNIYRFREVAGADRTFMGALRFSIGSLVSYFLVRLVRRGSIIRAIRGLQDRYLIRYFLSGTTKRILV